MALSHHNRKVSLHPPTSSYKAISVWNLPVIHVSVWVPPPPQMLTLISHPVQLLIESLSLTRRNLSCVYAATACLLMIFVLCFQFDGLVRGKVYVLVYNILVGRIKCWELTFQQATNMFTFECDTPAMYQHL